MPAVGAVRGPLRLLFPALGEKFRLARTESEWKAAPVSHSNTITSPFHHRQRSYLARSRLFPARSPSLGSILTAAFHSLGYGVRLLQMTER